MQRRAFLGLCGSAALTFAARKAGAVAPSAPLRNGGADVPHSARAALVERELADVPGPGAAAALVVDGDVVAVARGRRHVNQAGACNETTAFRIASITKVLSGIALLQLRDEGKLTLDDPLSKFFPEADKIIYPSARSPVITLRHLVTHTSGLPRSVPNAISESGLASTLARLKLDFAPGSRTSYSNFGVGLVGPIVRRASGVPFREHMSARIFSPLGMTGARWEARDVDPGSLAHGHIWRVADGKRAIAPASGEWRMGAAESFGGLYASITDMAKLVAMQLAAYAPKAAEDVDPCGASRDPRDAGHDGALLSRATIRESHMPQLKVARDDAPGAERHGVCWWLGDELVWHNGATDEYSASVVLSPSRRVGAIVLSNQPEVSMVERAARRIARAFG